jgi:TonB family protein
MNTIPACGLSLLVATAAIGAPQYALASDSEDACHPRVLKSETRYPKVSQLRGQTGTVYIDVTVGEDGRAQRAQVHESSGFRLLDRAAAQSVANKWVFDVSTCERKDLPIDHRVAVEYRG